MHSEDEEYEVKLRVQNTRGALKDRIPDLDIGLEGVETTSHSALKITFTKQMVEWPDFYEEVTQFYHSKIMRDLFNRTSRHLANLPLDFADSWENIAVIEPVQVGDELTMSGRFAENVLGKVLKVILAFNSKKYSTPEELEAMVGIPMSSIKIGSSKINPKGHRPNGEPDILVKMPGTGPVELQRVRLIGELKSPSTYKMCDHYNDFKSFKPDSLKNLFGESFTYCLLSSHC